MRSIYVGVGGLAAGGEKDTCQEREKKRKNDSPGNKIKLT